MKLLLSFLICLNALAAKPDETGKVRIDRVELSGVSVIGVSLIEGALEIGAGDYLERARVVRSAENLQRLYRIRGYEEVRIQSEISQEKSDAGVLENVLAFKVIEGRPTRIAELLVRSSAQSKLEQNAWTKLQQDIAGRIGLQVNDVFDQEKVSDAKRNIQDLLAAYEYIGAKVSEVEVKLANAPASTSQEIQEKTYRWVKVEVDVDPGDRVTFGFRGNKVFTKSEFSKMIESQRLVGLGTDYVGAIQKRLIEEYLAVGFANVKIVAYPIERKMGERHVTYEIFEGERVYLEEVSFEGNQDFTLKELTKQFFQVAPALVQNRVFVDKDVDLASEKLIEWMRSKGYLSAKQLSIQKNLELERPNARVQIYIYEGEQTRVRKIEYGGRGVLSAEEINKILGIKQGEPLNLYAFNEGLELLKTAYKNHGYIAMGIENEDGDDVITYSYENRLADVYLKLDEGLQYRAGRIDVQGLQKTHQKVVLRELRFKEGDVLALQKILTSEARLRKLGIFSSANIRFEDDPSRVGFKRVFVVVEEGTPGIIGGGVGFRNDLGVRLFLQGAYTNLYRRNQTLSLDASANRRVFREYCRSQCFIEYEFAVGYIWPWFVMDEMTFRPRVVIDKVKYYRFSAATASLSLAWEKPLFESIPLTGIFSYNLERINQFDAEESVDEQGLRIGSVIPALRLDYRDNVLSPRKGFFSTLSYEVADPAFLSQRQPFPVGYVRAQFRSDVFIPIAEKITGYFSFRTGYERSTQDAENPGNPNPDSPKGQIPLIKRFALGGLGSLRGFQEQELNLQNVSLFGSASYVNYRAQVDLPFFADMRFGPFLDAANLNIDHYSFGRLRYGTGVGFRYITPVGPVNFDWGFKINPQPHEDPYRFYFSIGVF